MGSADSTPQAPCELEIDEEDIAREVIEGLSREQKRLPCKLFYDSVGSRLFDRICELPEYYVTDAEVEILERQAKSIAARLGTGVALIELGSGSCTKVRLLLDELENPAAYLPVDVSAQHLALAAREVAKAYPDLDVLTVSADFTRPFELPPLPRRPRHRVVFFPGSTIGNFERADAVEFLRLMAELAETGGGVLIGIDLRKDPGVIEAAYNDSQGVTARFNLNILNVVNRQADADFLLHRFEHDAVYDEERGRIEMRLVSRADHEVSVGDQRFELRRGEHILTEYSHKYTFGEFAAMADEAGLRVRERWCDSEQLFSVQYLEVVE